VRDGRAIGSKNALETAPPHFTVIGTRSGEPAGDGERRRPGAHLLLGGIGNLVGQDGWVLRPMSTTCSGSARLGNARTPSLAPPSGRGSSHLQQRWAAGVTDAVALTAEITTLGYRGSVKTVRRYLQPRAFLGTVPAGQRRGTAADRLASRSSSTRAATPRCDVLGADQMVWIRPPFRADQGCVEVEPTGQPDS